LAWSRPQGFAACTEALAPLSAKSTDHCSGELAQDPKDDAGSRGPMTMARVLWVRSAEPVKREHIALARVGRILGHPRDLRK